MSQFKDGAIEGVVIKELKRNMDYRGWLIEIFRQDEMMKELLPMMAYVSLTKPGIVRGPHEHRSQTDFFAFVGPSTFKCFLWDNRENSKTYGNKFEVEGGGEDKPIVVIIPPGIVHGYKNIGLKEGFVFNLPNKLYKGSKKLEPVDEIRHEDDLNSIFKIE